MSIYSIRCDEIDPRVIVRFNLAQAAVIGVERLAVNVNVATGSVTVYDVTAR
jgi:hypothetical protein